MWLNQAQMSDKSQVSLSIFKIVIFYRWKKIKIIHYKLKLHHVYMLNNHLSFILFTQLFKIIPFINVHFRVNNNVPKVS